MLSTQYGGLAHLGSAAIVGKWGVPVAAREPMVNRLAQISCSLPISNLCNACSSLFCTYVQL